MRFKPSVFSVVVVVIGSLITARLGVWQLSRYDGKQAAMQVLRDAHARDPVTSIDAAAGETEFRRATLTGTYRAQGYVATGGIPFGLNGYAVIGVLDVEGGDSVLVERGWIPVEDDWPRFLTHDSTTVTVEGVLRQVPEGPVVEPVTDIRTGETLWPLERETFLVAFSRGVHIPWSSLTAATEGARTDVYLQEGPLLSDPEARKLKDLPASGYVLEKKTIHHLEYAAQWFGFSVLQWIIWGIVGWRRGRRLADG